MSLPLFLVPVLPASETFVLDGPEGHHAADVQRMRVGEELMLGDGLGGLAFASVTSVAKGRLELAVHKREFVPLQEPRLVVAQGIAKGDRSELAVQAMTEVGVDEIVPWEAMRSIGRLRADRWATTAREASKQARRAWVPFMGEPVSTKALAERATFVLHEEATARLSTVELPAAGEIVLVVGPEGGIDARELDLFAGAGATTVRLGDNVLRTSTAGVAALAVLATRLGRW
ncbi:16S rRNA (uracil(1498)-N(3))-methyltransferase [Allorhizocola rhizosphaerae]|uniref:16S rRNA (uracil(1498)-N(3))-methyltransferase n=1 Tax=Allorhizocola rhizosphaerae TaxID=1872709 RepID=UPI000E3C5698|nr:16S rRNA (uracil(1498)-N(3))-methyltransferase [Allorhizocola rhizosphaerae]